MRLRAGCCVLRGTDGEVHGGSGRLRGDGRCEHAREGAVLWRRCRAGTTLVAVRGERRRWAMGG